MKDTPERADRQTHFQGSKVVEDSGLDSSTPPFQTCLEQVGSMQEVCHCPTSLREDWVPFLLTIVVCLFS